MATINSISIRTKLVNAVQASKRFQGLAFNNANTRLTFAKIDLMKNIDESIVSQDIVEACEDPATTQKDIISKGNIAAAIGFEAGAKPIDDLKNFLKINIEMDDKAKISTTKNRVDFAFEVKLPNKEEIGAALPGRGVEKWTTRSWIDMIENGIDDLAKFIFWSEGFGKDSGSRSGTGLQSKGEVQNEADFTPQPEYLNDIFKKFIERFK